MSIRADGDISFSGGMISVNASGGTGGSGSSNGFNGYNGSTLIGAGGNMEVGGSNFGSMYGDLRLFAGGTLNIADDLWVDSGSLVLGGGEVALNGTQARSSYDTVVAAGSLLLDGGASIGAAGNLLVIAGSVMLDNNSYLESGVNTSVTSAGDIRLNNGSYILGNDIQLNLAGSTSTLFLNEAPGASPSTIGAISPDTIYLNYLGRSSGGLVVDGRTIDDARVFRTEDGGSGFYANGLPAFSGAGLEVTYRDIDGPPGDFFDTIEKFLSSDDGSNKKRKTRKVGMCRS